MVLAAAAPTDASRQFSDTFPLGRLPHRRAALRLLLLAVLLVAAGAQMPEPAQGFLVSVKTSKGSRCGTDDDVLVNVRGNGGQTGWKKVDFGPRSNDFEQGDTGNYELWGGHKFFPTSVCLKKKCVMFSDDWCPETVTVHNRLTMDHFGTAKFRKISDCNREHCVGLQPPPAKAQPSGELMLDILFMGDIGHSYEHASILTRAYPMGKNKVAGSFSLYNGLYDFVVNQGHKPEAVLIMGDVGYVGGDKLGTSSMRDTFQKYLNKVVPEDMVFPQIGNHDVHYIGCIFPTPANSCYYGAATYAITMGSVSSESIHFDQWMGNWASDFPGLTQKAILPPRQAHAPGVKEWAGPLRYNINLKPESSIYVIAGLVPGAAQTTWGPVQPDVAKPAEKHNRVGSSIECSFIYDSVAHGRSLGKTVFIYVTHDFTELPCPDVLAEVDVWLYGHIHTIDQNVPHNSVVTQEWRKQSNYPPVRMLIGNGGFDEGEEDTVSFGNLREYRMNGRVRVHFDVYDTCIADENCPSGIIPNQHCWDKCKHFDDGYHGSKATPSKKSLGFVYEAPAGGRAPSRASSSMEGGGPSVNLPEDEEEMSMKEDTEVEEWSVDQTATMLGSSHIPVGCISTGLANVLADTEAPNGTDVALCKQTCMDRLGCGAFNFDFDTSKCLIQAGQDGTMRYRAAPRTVTGPADCGKIAKTCEALPTEHFPADNNAASMAAWPTGFQPQKLQCWPRRDDGSLYSCPAVTVLRDVEQGWPGKCARMIQKHLGSGEYCRDTCLQSPTCPAWLEDAQGNCYHGIGDDCFGGNKQGTSVVQAVKGQRLIKGTYRVLANITGDVLLGLGQVLSPASIHAAEELGQDAATVCRETCLSYTICQYWQLRRNSGCYIEMHTDLFKPVRYPLTRRQFAASPEDPAIAGEYVQRFCPNYFSTGDTAAEHVTTAAETQSIIGLAEAYHRPLGRARAGAEGSNDAVASAADDARGAVGAVAAAALGAFVALGALRRAVRSWPRSASEAVLLPGDGDEATAAVTAVE